MSIPYSALHPIPRKALRRPVFTTGTTPRHLAWLALHCRLHASGLLYNALLEYLWGVREHDVAMTFVNEKPVCIALLSGDGQLMVFTRRTYRGQGYAKRTARLLSRRTGVPLTSMTGGPGKRPGLSKALFNSLGVEYMP